MLEMTDHEDESEEAPSKSLRKRQSHDLQNLGEALIQLPQSELDALPLPDILRDAVMLARRITKHGGLYRQKQLIGKLMRKVDAEPIRAAIDARRELDRAATRQFHLIERWRTRLLMDTTACDEFVQAYPNVDRATIVELIAQARREQQDKRTPKAARELFGIVEKAMKRE
jgi:ribosome-associated protein